MTREKRKIDRGAWKGASVTAIKEHNDELKSSGFDDGRVPTLKIESGKNTFRIFPAHPGSDPDNLYYKPLKQIWLPYVTKDDKKTSLPHKNARVHYGQEFDIVEQYLKVATELIPADNSLSSKEKAELLDLLADYKKGLKFNNNFASYAKKIVGDKVERGLLEISKARQEELNTESTVEVDSNPDGIDIISDPDEGRDVIIQYNPDEKDNKKKYKTTLGRKDTPLDDDDFAWLEEQEPLVDYLNNADDYHQGAFDKTVKGLELYDQKNGIGIFDTPEFKDIVSEIRSTLPESPYGESEDGEEGIPFEDMTRAELKQWIMDNEVDVRVKRGMDEDDILNAIEEELGYLPELSTSKLEPGKDDQDEDEKEDEDLPIKDESTKTDDDDVEDDKPGDTAPPERSGRSERRSSRRRQK